MITGALRRREIGMQQVRETTPMPEFGIQQLQPFIPALRLSAPVVEMIFHD